MSAPETPEQQMPTPTRVTMRSRRRRNRMLFNRQQRIARDSELGAGPVLPDWFRAIRDSIRKRDMEGILTVLARSGLCCLQKNIAIYYVHVKNLNRRMIERRNGSVEVLLLRQITIRKMR